MTKVFRSILALFTLLGIFFVATPASAAPVGITIPPGHYLNLETGLVAKATHWPCHNNYICVADRGDGHGSWQDYHQSYTNCREVDYATDGSYLGNRVSSVWNDSNYNWTLYQHSGCEPGGIQATWHYNTWGYIGNGWNDTLSSLRRGAFVGTNT